MNHQKQNKDKNKKDNNTNNEESQTQPNNEQITLDITYEKKYTNLDAYAII